MVRKGNKNHTDHNTQQSEILIYKSKKLCVRTTQAKLQTLMNEMKTSN